MTDETSTPIQTLAEKLTYLFRTIHPRDKGEYTIEDVANGIRQRGGPTISATYVWQLRTGLRDNPTKKHLEALAGFFGVPAAYFFDDAATERINAQLDLLAVFRDSPIGQLAHRARGVSPGGLKAIADMLEHVRMLEGVPEDQGDGDEAPGPAPSRRDEPMT